MAIEVFDLPENDDMFSPSELDTTKLAHKFKEVSSRSGIFGGSIDSNKYIF